MILHGPIHADDTLGMFDGAHVRVQSTHVVDTYASIALNSQLIAVRERIGSIERGRRPSDIANAKRRRDGEFQIRRHLRRRMPNVPELHLTIERPGEQSVRIVGPKGERGDRTLGEK